MDSEAWARVPLRDLLVETHERANTNVELPVLSVTKSRGLMLAADRFARALHGRDLSKYRVARSGSIVIDPMLLWDGSLGAQHVCPAGLVSPDYRVFAPAQATYDETWLSRLLRSPAMIIEYKSLRRGTNTRRSRISRDDFLEISVPLPPLREQRRIAAVLEAADDAVAAARGVVDQTEKLKRGMTDHLLTRGLPGRHKRARQTEIGDVPESWDVGLLDEVAERGSGHTPSKSFPEYWDGGIKWVSLKDSSKLDRVYITTTEANISEQGIQNSSAVVHPAGTVVLSRDAGVGKSAVMTEPMAVSQHFIAWQCGPRLHNVFFYYWLQKMKPQFDAVANGSTIKTIGLGYFKKLLVPLPPLEEQQTIAAVLLAHDEAIGAAERATKQAMLVREGLVNDLLFGRIRVPA